MSTSPIAPVPAAPKTSGLAIVSLVLGIVSFGFCLTIFSAIPAVICGHVALGRINRSGGALNGKGLALAGLIIGYVAIAMFPLLAAIAVPNFVRARQVAQTNLCINNLRRIDGAKQTWALEGAKKPSDLPTPQDLDKYLGQSYNSLHCPAGGTYSINRVDRAPTCSKPGHELPGSN